jgi:hypothetical protein
MEARMLAFPISPPRWAKDQNLSIDFSGGKTPSH